MNSNATLSHPNGATFTPGDAAPDDWERMNCPDAGRDYHQQCGVYECCGWPRFLVCPCRHE